ncbi:GL14887 [Drosophila persimilis]|uniref:GL14887 n=1 Tax=Drosophila persimilis TaxID=7234 RepID=B4H0C3_DROPE|nr:GL14887 [Drosophila persimilis]
MLGAPLWTIAQIEGAAVLDSLYRSTSFHSEECLLDMETGEELDIETHRQQQEGGAAEGKGTGPGAQQKVKVPMADGGVGGVDLLEYATYLPRVLQHHQRLGEIRRIPAKLNVGLESPTSDKWIRSIARDEFGTQRVYKKTSPNCVLTLYLPTREMTLTGDKAAVLRGILFVDPKAIQGYRVYAQLTLTFRYGREDEEVMGLRFCNEAIMSLHQIWPRLQEPAPDSLSPLQEALMKRLGGGAHAFTLVLNAHSPPSVQLVPAKRYYGAPIGTSYDVRCFIADKTDEKFHRRASVKMGVRVIYRTDVFQHSTTEHFATCSGCHHQAGRKSSPPAAPSSATLPVNRETAEQQTQTPTHSLGSGTGSGSGSKSKGKSERGDSFPKLRLSPKAFRFSGRFGRSKSEIEKCPPDSFHNYSKSFQEHHCDCMLAPFSGAGVSGGIGSITLGPDGGPQGSVDKPFLLHDGRVGLKASLDKGWYTHGEDVNVTIEIRNDSRKTVRKVRVCAIQHVDVCMFNNGKFKNVVADSEQISPPVDRTVSPGATVNSVVVLRPQRGQTKNWIALEDSLQRSTEPDEITGEIAASAIRPPHYVVPNVQQAGQSLPSPAMAMPSADMPPQQGNATTTSTEDRNIFAIYATAQGESVKAVGGVCGVSLYPGIFPLPFPCGVAWRGVAWVQP